MRKVLTTQPSVEIVPQNKHCIAFNMDDQNQRSRKNYPFWFIITSTSSNHEQLGTITASHWMDRLGLREFSDNLNILPVTKKSQRTCFILVPPKNLMTTLWLYGSTNKTVFADSVQTEYCSTFHCPSVCLSVTGVTSHISHIYKGINAMLIIRDPSTPIYSESKSSWLSF